MPFGSSSSHHTNSNPSWWDRDNYEKVEGEKNRIQNHLEKLKKSRQMRKNKWKFLPTKTKTKNTLVSKKNDVYTENATLENSEKLKNSFIPEISKDSKIIKSKDVKSLKKFRTSSGDFRESHRDQIAIKLYLFQ